MVLVGVRDEHSLALAGDDQPPQEQKDGGDCAAGQFLQETLHVLLGTLVALLDLLLHHAADAAEQELHGQDPQPELEYLQPLKGYNGTLIS